MALNNIAEKSAVRDLIGYFGTQREVGEALGIEQPAISQWLHGKTRVKGVHALKAERLTNGAVRAIDLCPELLDVQ